jgi:hypothetical protein
VDAAQPGDPALRRLGQGAIRQDHVGELRVAALGRQLDGMQHRQK